MPLVLSCSLRQQGHQLELETTLASPQEGIQHTVQYISYTSTSLLRLQEVINNHLINFLNKLQKEQAKK